MVSTDQAARLRYLGQASEVLAVPSPTVSSYLRATKRDATVLQGLEETTPESICKACSRTLLVGWSCEPVRSKDYRQSRQQRLSSATTVTKCVKCLACGTENTIQHRKRSKTMRRSNKQINDPEPTAASLTSKKEQKSTPTPDQAPTPAPAPPQKEQTPDTTRAKPTACRKARGKHASLQALVANKKPEAPKNSGLGLDFMDFMK